jgi:branched-subunit amino acid transport protein AzlD
MTTGELILFFAVMGIATFLTRAAPFVLLKSHKDSRWLLHFGHVLPVMILVVLVGFSGVGLIDEQANRQVLIAIAMVITALVHLLFRQAMVSILLGTAVYVLGIQWLGW